MYQALFQIPWRNNEETPPQKKKFSSHKVDVLKHKKTFRQINKMHYILYVDTSLEEDIKIGKGIKNALEIWERDSVV